MDSPRRLLRGAGLALAVLAPLTAPSAQARTFPGFNVSYAAPAGWRAAGRDGRADAWQGPNGSGLIAYAGSYSSGLLAVADGGAILRDLDEQTPTVLQAAGDRSMRGVPVTSMTVRVRGNDGRPMVLQFAARTSPHGTALGVLAMSAPADTQAARTAAEAVLASMTATAPVPDAEAARRLVGTWARQESNVRDGSGYVTEESWAFEAGGGFTHARSHTVSLPGAAVEPERSRERGRWQVIGGGLVVTTDEGRTTVAYTVDGRTVTINGSRFLRR